MNSITFGRLATTGCIAIPMGASPWYPANKLGDDVRPGTWRAILKQTGIEEPQ